MDEEKKNEFADDLTVSGFVDQLLEAVSEALLQEETGLNSAKVEERLKLTKADVVKMLVAKRALIRLFDAQGMKGVDGVMQMLYLERPEAAQEGILRALTGLVGREPLGAVVRAPSRQKQTQPKKKTRPPWA